MKSAFLAVASGISWGRARLWRKTLQPLSAGGFTLSPRQMVYAAIIMTVVALLVPQRTIDWQPYVFWALSYSAILATAVARSLWLFVLRKLPAGIASLSTLAVPVCGVLFSWWLLGEKPGSTETAGS